MNKYVLSSFFVLAGVACSSSEPGPGAQESKLKNEGLFCGEWAKAACNADVVSACNGTRAGCLTTQKSACQVLVPPGYSSENAQDCLDAVNDAYEDSALTADELDVVLKLGGACSALVDGGIVEGGDCSASFDCDTVNGFDCVIKPGDVTGSCQVPVAAGPAESCADPEAVCEADLYCADSADGPVCLPRKGNGLSCTSEAACQEEFLCDLASANPTCVPRVANTDPCLADSECASRVCIGPESEKICVTSVRLSVESSLCRTLR